MQSQTSSKLIRSMRVTMPMAIIAMGLTGCLGIDKKDDLAASVEKPVMGPELPAAPQATAPSSAKTASYTDPFVTKGGTRTANAKRPAVATGGQPTQMAQAAPMPDANAPANQLGSVVNQPTTVNAGSNSIFALAQPPATDPGSAASYLPQRNFNATTGSMFSLKPSAAIQPAQVPVQAPSAATENGAGGLW
ncbi:hypothetical protein [Rhizobium oryzicola]|uniref:Lipoprotein n=1 Tax=Rhizobium oryzicola TaxID=1232668 RepID=A0ABT8T1T9_9HYPH|nr:hypothetical protein [Rhizobium oryzicola]MDO1583852.1 hypothetical protein [Rhizobium oryzicola]